MRFGACVTRARLQARLGRPMPTKTMSRSRSSEAAAQTIASMFSAPACGRVGCRFSAGVLIAIVDAGAQSLLGGEPVRESRNLREIFLSIADAENEFVEVLVELLGVPRDFFPRDVELVVAIVI